jgi:hypothetical protein
MTQEIQDSTLELEQMDIPFHGMDRIIFMLDDKEEYGKWYSEDNTALGFQFNHGDLKDTFVYILRDSITISENGVSFKHKVIRNPHNVDKSVFESDEFYDLLAKAMNDVVAEMLEWQGETNDA